MFVTRLRLWSRMHNPAFDIRMHTTSNTDTYIHTYLTYIHACIHVYTDMHTQIIIIHTHTYPVFNTEIQTTINIGAYIHTCHTYIHT